jgi:uncharacterized phage infection (PIP) family protein YhgE
MSKKIVKVSLESLSDKVDKLASAMEGGFKSIDKQFEKVDKRLENVDTRFKSIDNRLEILDTKITKGFDRAEENREILARIIGESFLEANTNIKQIDEKVIGLAQGQEDIQLRLDSMAPQFEVSELQRRAKRLEDRTGIKYTPRA